jgi:2-polyprenyl-3-methyl-5-hydroxy-6-metoxy-1,4-benzoquinol methylase
MGVYTTEIASDKITSDNPIHQRLLKAYYLAKPYMKGDILEVGCGEGRGVEFLAPLGNSYTAIDKIESIIGTLTEQFPASSFILANIPPFSMLEDDKFDVIVSFQVIEHIKEDKKFISEMYRVLKPGGVALLTTPNKPKTLTRNPWHIREYTTKELKNLTSDVFEEVEMKGITGSDRVWSYYEENKRSVKKITKFDIFNLQYWLPSSLLRIPYDLLNRLNRNNLEKGDFKTVNSIGLDDYLLSSDPDSSLDLFAVLRKK